MNLFTEVRIFISAMYSGSFLLSVYYLIEMIRKMIRHREWTINLEDVLFWIFAGGYLFVQIYHTNNGNIRLYYVLGLVLGAVLSWKILRLFEKVWKKFVHFKKEKRVD